VVEEYLVAVGSHQVAAFHPAEADLLEAESPQVVSLQEE
jgi:hypothetical protein